MLSQEKTDDYYAVICSKLGYSFRRKYLLREALTRTTAIVERVDAAANNDYQRLEFLGDKVIGTALSTILFEMHPEWKEGRLSIIYSRFSSNAALAKLADVLALGEHLIIGKADARNGIRDNQKALADVVESLFGAIYLDSGKNINQIETLILKHWQILGLEEIITETADVEHQNSEASAASACQPEDTRDRKLIAFILQGPAEKVEKYLERGAKPNVAIELNKKFKNKICLSALQIAASVDEDAYEKMECLLRHGADPDWQMGYHLIDQVPVTRNSFMFSFQAPQYQRYFHRQTVLHRIVKNYLSQKISFDSALPMIKLLSQYHAQFDLVDAKGKTALQLLRDAQAQIYADVGYFEKPVNKQEMKYLIQLIQNLSIEKKPQTPGAAIHELENNLREELLSTVFADFEEDSIEGMLDTLVGASLRF